MKTIILLLIAFIVCLATAEQPKSSSDRRIAYIDSVKDAVHVDDGSFTWNKNIK